MRNDLLAYITVLSAGLVIPANIQYTEYDDGSEYFREGARNGYQVIDQTLTPTGFSGDKNTDWKNVSRSKLP